MGEAELRLGWERLGGMQGRGKVGGSFKGEKVSIGIEVGGGGEGVLAMGKHGTRVVGSEAAGLGVEINKEDGIGLPVAEGADGSLVNTRDEEGSSSTRAETIGFNAFRRDVSDMVDSGCCTAKFKGDFAGDNVMWMVGGVIVAIQGAVGGCMMLDKMLDTALDGADGAEVEVTREAMAEGFPMHAVLLIGVGKGDVGPLLHVMPRTHTGGDALEGRTVEGGVGEVEGLASTTVGGRRQAIFPGATEEVEGKGAQVKDGLGAGAVWGLGEGLDQGMKDRDVDGPDAGGSGVLIRPGPEEGLEAKDVMGAIQPGIGEAQSGECLPH